MIRLVSEEKLRELGLDVNDFEVPMLYWGSDMAIENYEEEHNVKLPKYKKVELIEKLYEQMLKMDFQAANNDYYLGLMEAFEKINFKYDITDKLREGLEEEI